MGIVRFILAMSVIIAHTSPIFGSMYVGGVIAVKAFYIISGFYMSLILNEKYVQQKNSYKLFISNRFLKLYPFYWVVLLATLGLYTYTFFAMPRGNTNLIYTYQQFYQNVNFKAGTLVFFILINLFLIAQDSLLFMGLNTKGNFYFAQNFRDTNPQLYNFLAIPQAWTISLELMFYLLAPFIVKRKLTFVIPIIICCFIAKLIFYKMGYKLDPWNYRFFPFELGFFLLGNVCYRIYLQLKKYTMQIEKFYLLVVTLFLALTYVYYKIPLHFIIKEYLYYSFIFAIIPILFIASKKYKWDNYIGDLSYLLYISHMLVVLIITTFKWPVFNQIGLLTVVISMAFSLICKHTLLNKIEKIRQNRVKPINA